MDALYALTRATDEVDDEGALQYTLMLREMERKQSQAEHADAEEEYANAETERRDATGRNSRRRLEDNGTIGPNYQQELEDGLGGGMEEFDLEREQRRDDDEFHDRL